MGNEKKNIDALAAAKEAVERGDEKIEFASVDAFSSSEIMRFLESKGFDVQLSDDDGRLTLTALKSKTPKAPAPKSNPLPRVQEETPVAPKPRLPIMPHPTIEPAPSKPVTDKGLTLIVLGRTMGRGMPELEELLIKNFLAEFARMDTPPENIVLLNDGVLMAVFDTSTCDLLKDMEAKGSRVLVSDLCAGHLGVTGDIGVGVIANVVDIMDAINNAGKLIYL